MFETNIEMNENGMTVPYPPLFDKMRKNYGFIDTRGRPELASEITEASESLEMRKLLTELAQPDSKIFSVGCDLGTKLVTEEELPYTAGGYVQIMHINYAHRSPRNYARYAAALADMLKTGSENHEWRVDFVLTPVAFKLDHFSDMTGSLWIWFHAFACSEEGALGSRETLIAELGQALTNDRNSSLIETAE